MSRFIGTLKSRGLVVPLCVAAVLSVVGLAVWVAELAGATGGIGTNDVAPWGAYLMVFIFFVGLGAGSALVSVLGSVFRVKACEPYVVPGLVMGIAFACLDLAFLVIDVLFGITSSNALDATVPQAMLSGALAPYLWAQVVLYAAAIVLLALPAEKAPGWSRPVAAVLALRLNAYRMLRTCRLTFAHDSTKAPKR